MSITAAELARAIARLLSMRSRTETIDLSPPVISTYGIARTFGAAIFIALVGVGLVTVTALTYEAVTTFRSPVGVELRGQEWIVITQNPPPPIQPFDRLVAIDGVPIEARGDSVDALISQLPRQPQYTAVFERSGGRQRIETVLTLESGGVWAPVTAALLTMVAAFGLLTLASRDRAPQGRREFIALCAVTSALLVTMAPASWSAIAQPLAGLRGGSRSDWLLLYAFGLWPALYGLFLGRFLICVVGEPAGSGRWLFGWRLTVLIASGLLLGTLATYPLLGSTGVSVFIGLLVVLFLGASVLRGRSAIGLAVIVGSWITAAAALILLRGMQVDVTIDAWPLAQAACVIGTIVMAISGLVRWPAAILRLARQGHDTGGLTARQVEVAMSGARLGCWVFLASLMLAVVGFSVLFRTYWGRADEMLASNLVKAFLFGVVILLIVSVALPFLGVFLAVTRKGLWNADLLFRRIVFGTSVGAVFFVFWEIASFALSSLTEGVINPMSASLASALALALVRPRLERSIDRLVFPTGGELTESLQRLRLEVGTVEQFLTPDRMSSIRVSRAAVIKVRSKSLAHARCLGSFDRHVTAATLSLVDAPSEFEHFTILEDRFTWFAFLLRLEDGSDGIVLLEPARGARLHDDTERRDLLYVFHVLRERLFGAASTWWPDE